MPRSYNLSLNSEFAEAEKIPGFVEQLCSESGLSEDIKGRVMLALSEAVTNAIIHGNREVPGKEVKVSVNIDEASVTLNVHDEGEGFNPEEIPDPTEEKNLFSTGGRGLFLIEEYADAVSYLDSGRQVIMKFYRVPEQY